jgi:hypothetical protein
MSNALQHPHTEVSFTHAGDDTISAFKLKFEKVHIPIVPAPPAKVTQRTCPAEPSNPILTSPVLPPRQARSQTTIYAKDRTNAPLPPRVVTPMLSQPSPLRVPRRSQNLAPRNLSQDDFCGMDTAHMAIAHGNHHWSQVHQANAVVHPITRKEMEYMSLMKGICNHFGHEVLATNAGAFFKVFETFLEPTHDSLLNSLTSRKTERSLLAK